MIHAYTTATPRQQKREATFARIIEVATEMLAAGGLDALTMQHLAGELGFAVGALYRYFPSKDAIIVAVQCRIVDTIHAELVAALERANAHVERSSELDPRQAALFRLWVLVHKYELMARQRPTEMGLLSAILGDPRQLVKDEDARLLLPSMVRLLQWVDGLFGAAAGVAALAPGDPARRTTVLWTAVQAAVQLRKLERFAIGALSATAVLEEAVGTLLVGWGADAVTVKAARLRARKLLGASTTNPVH